MKNKFIFLTLITVICLNVVLNGDDNLNIKEQYREKIEKIKLHSDLPVYDFDVKDKEHAKKLLKLIKEFDSIKYNKNIK